MTYPEIAKIYTDKMERDLKVSTELNHAVARISSAKGRYDIGAIMAQAQVERILDDPNNGLSPSDERMWQGRARFAEKYQGALSNLKNV